MQKINIMYFVATLILGICCTFFGALLKILHIPDSDWLLIFGEITTAVSMFLLVLKAVFGRANNYSR